MQATSIIKANHVSLDDRISLITQAKYRYEGTVTAMNLTDGTLCLCNVTYHGAENRKAAPQDQDTVGSTFDAITFWIKNIIDLKKINLPSAIQDSAVVSTGQLNVPRKTNQPNNYMRNRGKPFYRRWQNPHPRGQAKFTSRKPYTGPRKTMLDCSEPYDFESANAELEKELANLTIEKVATACDASDHSSNLATSSDQPHSLDSNESTQEQTSEIQDTPCYQPTKSFYDSIGRANGVTKASATDDQKYFAPGFTRRRRYTRRERALNIETFGVMATKSRHGHFKVDGKPKKPIIPA
ncbi:hypothetical protein Ciccas_011949 [Cichlidogyrus casuarinus]|uniref:DFDF domain-containing protein n=1 Tax=Cichlidogyrus casuarinus TaxID=1844966 RepID=A0ABD2PQH3_9PLAT